MSLTNAPLFRRTLVALVPVAIGLMPVAAQATDVSFTGQVPGGTDPLGGNYSVGDTGGGLVQFEEITGLQSDPTQSAVTLNLAGSGLADVTAFTLSIIGSSATFLSPDAGFGDYLVTYGADGSIRSDWTGALSADGTSITYSAASAADALVSGDGFNTISTILSGGGLPSDFAYTVTWSGDAVAPVPELSSWAMMLVGFGALGVAARRRRAVRVAAA